MLLSMMLQGWGMRNLSKALPILLVLTLVASAIVLVVPASAQTSDPSTPQFTVKYVNSSYGIPPIYGTDPFTGKQIVITPGSYVDNRTIQITILSQPFQGYQDSMGNYINLYYDIRSKGHYSQFTSDQDFGSHSIQGVEASKGNVTVISFEVSDWNIPLGGQIDFQVRATVGYYTYSEQSCGSSYEVTVGQSGWSGSQTVIAPSLVQTGINLFFDFLVVSIAVSVFALVVVLVLLHRFNKERQKKT